MIAPAVNHSLGALFGTSSSLPATPVGAIALGDATALATGAPSGFAALLASVGEVALVDAGRPEVPEMSVIDGDASDEIAEDVIAELDPSADAALDAIRALVARVAVPTVEQQTDAPTDRATPHPAPTSVREGEAEVAADRAIGETGASASTSAAAIEAARVAASPLVPIRSLDALDPEFRARLERVIGRMHDEFGHRVSVVESWRSQDRQEQLFAQGRTRPGEIVTWTQHSRHTKGAAADVYIDGMPATGRGAERLAAIAAEEGLRTLGPMDAGHVELLRVERAGPTLSRARAGIAAANDATLSARVRTVTEAMPGQVAAVAPPAAVAAVATVASVASVATPRVAAQVTAETSRATLASNTPDASPMSLAVGPAGTVSAHVPRDAHAGDRRSSGGGARERRADERTTDTRLASTDWTAMLAPASSRGSIAPEMGSLAPVAGAAMDARIDSIDAMRSSAQPDALASIVLKLDTPEGTVDRVRIDLRGATVGTTVEVADGARALDLASRTQELTTALAARGLEAESVRVRASGAGEGLHGAWMESPTSGTRGIATASGSSASHERGRDSGHSGGRAPHDDERPRSRRQPGGNPK
ncbi:MAG: M15 family metallopeptidase [Gemmatimonadaceae bacterium]|nr:M15 family metallopeptidase [Gemmatimonadaceae bacterium]